MIQRKTLKLGMVGAAVCLCLGSAGAATLRWAGANDILTVDPHAQNHQTTHALAMCCRDGVDLAQPQLVKLGQLHARLHALSLIGYQQAWLAQSPKIVGNVMVLRRYACAGVNHENHNIRLGHSLLGLLGHLAEYAA